MGWREGEVASWATLPSFLPFSEQHGHIHIDDEDDASDGPHSPPHEMETKLDNVALVYFLLRVSFILSRIASSAASHGVETGEALCYAKERKPPARPSTDCNTG